MVPFAAKSPRTFRVSSTRDKNFKGILGVPIRHDVMYPVCCKLLEFPHGLLKA